MVSVESDASLERRSDHTRRRARVNTMWKDESDMGAVWALVTRSGVLDEGARVWLGTLDGEEKV